jgi:HNH endonuclease
MPAHRNSFFTHMSLDERSGCWNYTGHKIQQGYGVMMFHQKEQLVHRISAALYLGYKFDSGLDVLHRCDNPSCFNPKHLFIGTHRENMLDMKAKGRHGILKMVRCRKGHPFSGENLRIDRRGHRICRACKRDTKRSLRAEGRMK